MSLGERVFEIETPFIPVSARWQQRPGSAPPEGEDVLKFGSGQGTLVGDFKCLKRPCEKEQAIFGQSLAERDFNRLVQRLHGCCQRRNVLNFLRIFYLSISLSLCISFTHSSRSPLFSLWGRFCTIARTSCAKIS